MSTDRVDVGPAVVALGGGHGLAATIRAARGYAGRVTAVVATADDGGSSGRLRAVLAMPAPGDIRRCLVAMAGAGPGDEALGKALEHRFPGTDVEGHALGNLLLAALVAVDGDFVRAVDRVGQLLGLDPAAHRVLPATVEPVELHGATAAGDEVVGQVAITQNEKVERVWLEPEGAAGPIEVAEAILRADQVVLGPGSLYTSVVAAVVAPGVRDALTETEARLVYVCNLRSDTAEARGYDVARHVEALWAHGVRPDVVLVDEDCPLPLGSLGEAADPAGEGDGVEVVTAAVARAHGLAHDSDKLASALASLCSGVSESQPGATRAHRNG